MRRVPYRHRIQQQVADRVGGPDKDHETQRAKASAEGISPDRITQFPVTRDLEIVVTRRKAVRQRKSYAGDCNGHQRSGQCNDWIRCRFPSSRRSQRRPPPSMQTIGEPNGPYRPSTSSAITAFGRLASALPSDPKYARTSMRVTLHREPNFQKARRSEISLTLLWQASSASGLLRTHRRIACVFLAWSPWRRRGTNRHLSV